MSSQQSTLDQDRLNQFLGAAVGDLGAAISATLMLVGDRLGLYRALADGGPATSAELARRTGTHERYIREWLGNPGGRWLRAVRRRQRPLQPRPGAGAVL